MTIDDVAKVTKIQPRILEKLESGQLDGLPAAVFVKGFVRSFAKCVGLDESEALDRYSAAQAQAGQPQLAVAKALVEAMARPGAKSDEPRGKRAARARTETGEPAREPQHARGSLVEMRATVEGSREIALAPLAASERPVTATDEQTAQSAQSAAPTATLESASSSEVSSEPIAAVASAPTSEIAEPIAAVASALTSEIAEPTATVASSPTSESVESTTTVASVSSNELAASTATLESVSSRAIAEPATTVERAPSTEPVVHAQASNAEVVAPTSKKKRSRKKNQNAQQRARKKKQAQQQAQQAEQAQQVEQAQQRAQQVEQAQHAAEARHTVIAERAIDTAPVAKIDGESPEATSIEAKTNDAISPSASVEVVVGEAVVDVPSLAEGSQRMKAAVVEADSASVGTLATSADASSRDASSADASSPDASSANAASSLTGTDSDAKPFDAADSITAGSTASDASAASMATDASDDPSTSSDGSAASAVTDASAASTSTDASAASASSDASVSAAADASAASAAGTWQPTMPPLGATTSVPWRRPSLPASTAYVVPTLVIDDADPESADREREQRAAKEPHRLSFLPPILLDREDRSARQGGLTLAVIILLIAATLTLSYLMRRPSPSGDGVTMLDASSLVA